MLDVFYKAAAIMWDPASRETTSSEEVPSKQSREEGDGPATPGGDVPSPIESETARLNKLLGHAQARMQLIQTQQQTDQAQQQEQQEQQQPQQ